MTIPPQEALEQRLQELARRLHTLEVADDSAITTSSGGASRSTPNSPLDAIERIDQRIAESTPSEALTWIQIRDEIGKQDEYLRDRQHLRLMEKWGVVGKLGLSVIAVASGVGLAFGGFGYPAFICLGAGLYNLAPDFIADLNKRFRSKDRE